MMVKSIFFHDTSAWVKASNKKWNLNRNSAWKVDTNLVVLIIHMIISIWNKPKTNPSLPTRFSTMYFAWFHQPRSKEASEQTSSIIITPQSPFYTKAHDFLQLLFSFSAQQGDKTFSLGTSEDKAPGTVCLSGKRSLHLGNASSFIKWSSTASSSE